MKIKMFALLFLAAILLSACGFFPTTNDSLDGTSWELVSIGERPPLAGTTITLSFEDGLARGSSGCNSYGGAYQINGEQIEFQEFEATVMACLDPAGVMEQEQIYLQYLGEAQRFEMTNGQLQIYGSESETLTFVPFEQES